MTKRTKPAKPAIPGDELSGLARAKQASTGQLLLKSARLLDELAIARVNQEGQASSGAPPALRPVHTKLFPHIDFEGTRLGTIAERLGVTKQAVSQWVAELAETGVLELVPDPEDGRAKRVRFTPRGVEAIHHGLGVLRGIETELAARIGAKRMAALADALAALVPALEALHAHATSAADSR